MKSPGRVYSLLWGFLIKYLILMKKYLLQFFNIFLLIFIASGINAATYYLSPDNGDVNNSGAKDSPWPSLQELFASGVKLNAGDTLLLMTGNHGTAELKGINSNYIYIFSAPGEIPVISHLDIAKTAPTIKWHLKGITFSGISSAEEAFIIFYEKSMYIKIEKCTFLTNENINELTTDEIKSTVKKGIILAGSRHQINYNTFKGVSTAVEINADKCTFSGNRISDFTGHALLCNGSSNIFTNNLIKNFISTGFNAAAFKAISTPERPGKSNILLGNVIVDYTNPGRKNIAPLMGIVGFDGNYTDWIVENNVVITDHWHGITFFNISNSMIVNNTVIDPYLDVRYSNLEEEYRTKTFGPVRVWVAADEKGNKSENNRIANNLASDYLIENSEGINTNNIKVASTYYALDNYFARWNYLDFHLRDSALAVNAGNTELAPKIDADGTPRPLGSAVNAGAYEYSYIESGDQQIEIVAEKADVELRNHNQIPDWNGQKTIRVGGVGAGFDGVMVIPFALPPLPAGFTIKSASFSTNLEKIENSPIGNINIHGLIPRKSPEVLQSDFYQGDIMGDQLSRPIQQDFLGRNKVGTITTSEDGSNILTNYLNALYESGAVGGDYVFIRLSPSSSDVKDYTRWVFSSANADDFNNRPQMVVAIGKENNKKRIDPKELMIVSPDILYDGNVRIRLIGFEDDSVTFKIIDEHKHVVLEDTINKGSDSMFNYYTKDKLILNQGRYSVIVKNQTKEFVVW